MSRFEVKTVVDNIDPRTIDKYVLLLDTKTGQRLRIGNRGCSIRELVFRYNGQLINVIYNAEDWTDLQNKRPKKEVHPLEELEDVRRAAFYLRDAHPSWVDATTLDVANRTEYGEAVCQDPKTGQIHGRKEWPMNHQKSHSFLHGLAMNHDFEPIKSKEDDHFASVTYCVPIGIGINYFSTVKAYITFILSGESTKESGKIVNEGDEFAPIAFGRHPSFRIGSQGLEDHILRMKVKGALVTDTVFNPSGEINYDTEFSNQSEINLGGYNLDKTYLLSNPTIELINKATGHSLRIIGDEGTRMATVWTNELNIEHEALNRQHVVIEALVGTHAGMLSLPNKMIFSMIPKELRQCVLPPGQSLTYEQFYIPFKSNSRG